MRLNNRKGFTLLEVLTAISVIAIIAGPLLYLFVTSTRVGRHSYDTDKANTIAVGLVEDIKASPGGWVSKGYLLEEAEGVYVKNVYYDIDWEPTDEANASFRARIAISEAASSGGGGGAEPYLPQMNLSDGTRYIELTLPESPSGTYVLKCVEAAGGGSTSYTITTDQSHPIFRPRPGGSELKPSVTIESAQPLRVIPVVILLREDAPAYVKFGSENLTGVELALFVYGDPEGKYVTISDSTEYLRSGILSITYMKTPADTLETNKVNVTVAVERMDGTPIAAYTSLVYVPA